MWIEMSDWARGHTSEKGLTKRVYDRVADHAAVRAHPAVHPAVVRAEPQQYHQVAGRQVLVCDSFQKQEFFSAKTICYLIPNSFFL